MEMNDVDVGRRIDEELAGLRRADAARVPSDEARNAVEFEENQSINYEFNQST